MPENTNTKLLIVCTKSKAHMQLINIPTEKKVRPSQHACEYERFSFSSFFSLCLTTVSARNLKVLPIHRVSVFNDG